MAVIRPCRDDERPAVLEIVNAAAEAYRGVIPADRWHEPYMPAGELDAEIAAGVVFWGYEDDDGELAGVMGVQPVRDVELIRHAYVAPDRQRGGVGGALLDHLLAGTTRRVLVGTWAAATWAIAFYERHGFVAVAREAIASCCGRTGRSRTARSRRRSSSPARRCDPHERPRVGSRFRRRTRRGRFRDAPPQAATRRPMTTATPLRGISEIRAFFRTNQTPIYFVSPTAFNLLGIDRWVRNLFYVNYFDSFEGTHPRVFVPQERPLPRVRVDGGHLQPPAPPTARSTRRSRARGPGGKAVFVMFDEETEALAAKAGLEVALPAGRAAPPPRLEDRHDPARRRRRRAERAEHARPRDDATPSCSRSPTRPASATTSSCRRRTATRARRRSSSRARPTGTSTPTELVGRGAQGHEAHQLRGVGRRGGRSPATARSSARS